VKALGKFWEKTTIRMDLLRATKENKPSCIALRAGRNFFLWIVIIALIGCLQAQAEALYQGKPESFWLDSLTNANAERFMYEYKTKWLPLGTNAIPLVIKALDKHDVQNAEVIRCNAGFIFYFTQQGGSTHVLLHWNKQSRTAHTGNCAVESDI
jgi:hypothetical protein